MITFITIYQFVAMQDAIKTASLLLSNQFQITPQMHLVTAEALRWDLISHLTCNLQLPASFYKYLFSASNLLQDHLPNNPFPGVLFHFTHLE